MGQWWVLSLIDGNYTGCVLIMKCARQRGRLNIYKYMRLGYGLIRFLPHCRICFPNFFVPDRKQQPRLVAGIKLCDSFLPCSQLKVFCNETDSKARDRIVSIYHADCRHRVRMMSLLRSSSGSTPSINLRECGRWRTLKIKKSRNENHTSSDKTDIILHQASRTCFNQCYHSCTNTDFRLSLSTWTVCRVPSTSRPKVWPTYSVIAQVVLVVYSTRTNILLVWECIYVVLPRMSCVMRGTVRSYTTQMSETSVAVCRDPRRNPRYILWNQFIPPRFILFKLSPGGGRPSKYTRTHTWRGRGVAQFLGNDYCAPYKRNW